jgi:hypothetical protein
MIDIDDDQIIVQDAAGIEILGYRAEKTVKAGLFQIPYLAQGMGDRLLAREAWPIATVRIQAARGLFRLQPGDPFVLNSERYGIYGSVYRVTGVTEENIESGAIEVTAELDVRYLSRRPASISLPVVNTPAAAAEVEVLSSVRVMELPYALQNDEKVRIITMAGRQTGSETGYYVYMSLDGDTYARIGQVEMFATAGRLAAAYSNDTFEIDDYAGMTVTIATDANMLESISRAQMFGEMNLAVLGDEIISFQTIVPAGVGVYDLTGVMRGRYDSERTAHAADEAFFYLGSTGTGVFTLAEFIVGTTRYFKFVPYTAKRAGDISEAAAISLTISGRSRKPYRPVNLTVNDAGINPQYAGDIVLAWHPRLRTEGAGINDADTVTDAAPTWEGYFRVKVYVSDVLVRTVDGIDAATWTYTEAMNQTDNGALADSVVFSLTNYRTVSGIEYESAATLLTVRKEMI